MRFATFVRAVLVFADDALPVFLEEDDRDDAAPLVDRVVPLLDFVPEDRPLLERPFDDLPDEDFPPATLLPDPLPDAEAFFPWDAEEAPPLDFDLEPLVDFDDAPRAEVLAVEEDLLRGFEVLPSALDVFFVVPLPVRDEPPVVIVSAAAPTAPTAAPAAAPDMISPATSTTFSTIADAVDLRLLDEPEDDELPLRAPVELDLLAIEYSLP